MAKSRRKQTICKRKVEKAKKQRKEKLQIRKVKAEVEGYLAEADRLMKEGESLFKLALIERYEQPQPGFSISTSFAIRAIFGSLQSEKGFRSAFHNPPADWCPPFTKTTRYRDVERFFGLQWAPCITLDSWQETYSATSELYRSWIGSNEDRVLCDECARFDWRDHLVGFGGRSPPNRDIHGAGETSEDITKRTVSNFGGEYELSDSCTSFTLPSLANALENKSSCTFCSLLVSALRATATSEQIEHIAKDAQPIEVSCYNVFNSNHEDRWVLYVRFSSDERVAVGEWDVITIRFALLTTPDSLTWDPVVIRALKHAGRATIPSTQIDLGVIRSWWQRCMTEHPKCRNTYKSLSSHPTGGKTVFRVIDVEKNEVVIAPKACAYVALSYVWGGINVYQTKKCRKTRDILTGDEVIPIKRRRLPKTIRDALRVTELIGERYLWVDNLCIVQDDDYEREMTISRMDTIYRHSLLTIVAADSKDANSGLVGLEAGSRLIRSVVGCVDNIYLTLAEPAPELSHSLWSSRAWTYQEEQFSQRLLVFAHDRVYYKCADGSFGEARPLQRLKDSILSTVLEPELVQIMDDEDQVLYAYTQHVEAYTVRDLTYEADILHAFEGVMSHLSNISKDSYLFFWGLPSRDLVYALAWKRALSHFSLRRRSAAPRYWNGVAFLFGTEHPMRTFSSSIEFPSWCWAGWVGPVKYDIFEHSLLSCWSNSEHCCFSSTVHFPWVTTRNPEAMLTLWSRGILSLSADVATLDHDKIKQYEEHCADDDSCELCRGGTNLHSRTLKMDNGSIWESGTKIGVLLLNAVGFIDDFCSHTVLLIRRDVESGICYREGIIELQEREWEAAKPSREDLRLG